MNAKELTDLLNFIQQSPDCDALTATILKLAADSAALKTAKNKVVDKDQQTERLLKFTQKEIDSMPKEVGKFLIINNKTLSYREIRGMYQVRYHRDGYHIEVASKDFGELKRKFLAKLAEQHEHKPNRFPLMKDFVKEWLALKKPLVKESTYKSYFNLTNAEIIPAFGEKHIDRITRQDVQSYLYVLIDEGKNRTAQKIKQMLGAIFDIAAEDHAIKSPMTKIVLPHYEVEKGEVLTLEEEKRLIEFCLSHQQIKAISALLVLLYTGMRIGELPSMTYHDDGDYPYIECETEKVRKGYAAVFRKIPISPMMKKVLPYIDFEKAKTCSQKYISETLKTAFDGKHHPHELRYTFISRCKEHGCNLELVMLWDGHEFDKDVASSKVDRGYTQYTNNYYFREIEKVSYEV